MDAQLWTSKSSDGDSILKSFPDRLESAVGGSRNSMKKSFCKQTTLENYQEETAKETEKALKELESYLKENKASLGQVMKKRKLEEIEKGGMFSFLKSKVMQVLRGDSYRRSLVSETECEARINEVTEDMWRVFQYSQGDKEVPKEKGNTELYRDEITLPVLDDAMTASGASINGIPTVRGQSTDHSTCRPPLKSRVNLENSHVTTHSISLSISDEIPFIDDDEENTNDVISVPNLNNKKVRTAFLFEKSDVNTTRKQKDERCGDSIDENSKNKQLSKNVSVRAPSPSQHAQPLVVTTDKAGKSETLSLPNPEKDKDSPLTLLQKDPVGSNHLKRLRPPKKTGSPNKTATRYSKRLRKVSSESMQWQTPISIENPDSESLTNVLMRVMDEKFKNVHSSGPKSKIATPAKRGRFGTAMESGSTQ